MMKAGSTAGGRTALLGTAPAFLVVARSADRAQGGALVPGSAPLLRLPDIQAPDTTACPVDP